jgi:small subunit ribosomal protein S17
MTKKNKMKSQKIIARGIAMPKKVCTDKKCPFHGKLGVKQETYVGVIASKDASRSATITWNTQHYVPKYERYEKRKSRLRVHNPPCLDAPLGATVKVMRTRPLSKTKHFVVVEVMK